MANSPVKHLSSWFESPPGQRLLAEQAPILEEHVRRFHGDTLFWAGCHIQLTESVRGCMVRNRIVVLDDDTCNLESDLSGVCCVLHAIPLPNQSLDAVVLHHSLETVADPRMAIRELARVLAPGGRLVVCSFNPISAWGLRTLYGRLFTDHFSGLRLVSPFRLVDWLTLLGFELQERIHYLSYNLPFLGREQKSRTSQAIEGALRRQQFPVGGVYIISAVKQAFGVRRNRQSSRVRPPELSPVAYPKLSTWN